MGKHSAQGQALETFRGMVAFLQRVALQEGLGWQHKDDLKGRVYNSAQAERLQNMFHRLVRILFFDLDFGEKLSGHHLSEELFEVWLDALQTGDVDEVFQAFLQRCHRFDQVHTIEMEIVGVGMYVPPFSLGGVDFYRITPQSLQALESKLEPKDRGFFSGKSFTRDPAGRPELKYGFGVMARTRLMGVLEHCVRLARHRVEQVLQVLRLVFLHIHEQGSSTHADIHINGMGTGDTHLSLVYTPEHSWQRYATFNRPLAFADRFEEGMAEMEVARLVEVVQKPARRSSAMDGRLQRAIYWLSNSLKVGFEDNKLLSAVTALECLLKTTRSGAQISVAEGMAFLLGRNYRHRMDIIERYGKVYDQRSSLVHGDGFEWNTDDVEWAQHQALKVILHFMDHQQQFKSEQDVVQFIKQAKYS